MPIRHFKNSAQLFLPGQILRAASEFFNLTPDQEQGDDRD
jgi:hypothetical protein